MIAVAIPTNSNRDVTKTSFAKTWLIFIDRNERLEALSIAGEPNGVSVSEWVGLLRVPLLRFLHASRIPAQRITGVCNVLRLEVIDGNIRGDSTGEADHPSGLCAAIQGGKLP